MKLGQSVSSDLFSNSMQALVTNDIFGFGITRDWSKYHVKQ